MSIEQVKLEISVENLLFTEEIISEINSKGYKAIEFENFSLLVFLRWGVDGNSKFNINNYIIINRNHSDIIFGGSVCNSTLVHIKNSWKVLKQYNYKSKLQTKDAIERHIHEAKWVTSNDIVESNLFPHCSYKIKKDHFQIMNDFIPANTLGEILWEGKYSTYEILDFIGKIYNKLNSNIYKKRASFMGECYISKIKRRWENLKNKSNISIWSELEKKKVIINSNVFNSLEDILIAVSHSPNYYPLNKSSSFMCHGDLIPEDILVDCELNNFLLIDPNPQNTDPFCDWSKMIMSLYLYYEMAIRNQMTVNKSSSDELLKITYHFNSNTADYRNFIDDILFQLQLEDSKFLSELSDFNKNIKKKSLLLNAGLMAIAIYYRQIRLA